MYVMLALLLPCVCYVLFDIYHLAAKFDYEHADIAPSWWLLYCVLYTLVACRIPCAMVEHLVPAKYVLMFSWWVVARPFHSYMCTPWLLPCICVPCIESPLLSWPLMRISLTLCHDVFFDPWSYVVALVIWQLSFLSTYALPIICVDYACYACNTMIVLFWWYVHISVE